MKRRMRLLGTLALLACGSAPTHASAFRDWLHGMRRHDAFYLRAHVGFGYGMLSAQGGVGMDGAALLLSAEVGPAAFRARKLSANSVSNSVMDRSASSAASSKPTLPRR